MIAHTITPKLLPFGKIKIHDAIPKLLRRFMM
jgi:hypothetical protein